MKVKPPGPFLEWSDRYAIGVAPEYAQRGVGHALLQQLFLNLDALRIERVETLVAVQALPLLRFFLDTGFAPAQRLAFVKNLS